MLLNTLQVTVAVTVGLLSVRKKSSLVVVRLRPVKMRWVHLTSTSSVVVAQVIPQIRRMDSLIIHKMTAPGKVLNMVPMMAWVTLVILVVDQLQWQWLPQI
jgi:hypothetical protein